MAAEPTAQQMAALLTQWNDWLAGRTDAMLSLEDRVRTAGSDKDRADLAAAFVARKVVGDRLQAITDLADHDRARAAALATEPLVDNLGSPVGQNLADAAALVDAIVQRVESHVSTVETRSATRGRCWPLAPTVTSRSPSGWPTNSAVTSTGQLSCAATSSPVAIWRRVAKRASELRSELEQADAERRHLFETWTTLDQRLVALAEAGDLGASAGGTMPRQDRAGAHACRSIRGHSGSVRPRSTS